MCEGFGHVMLAIQCKATFDRSAIHQLMRRRAGGGGGVMAIIIIKRPDLDEDGNVSLGLD